MEYRYNERPYSAGNIWGDDHPKIFVLKLILQLGSDCAIFTLFLPVCGSFVRKSKFWRAVRLCGRLCWKDFPPNLSNILYGQTPLKIEISGRKEGKIETMIYNHPTERCLCWSVKGGIKHVKTYYDLGLKSDSVFSCPYTWWGPGQCGWRLRYGGTNK